MLKLPRSNNKNLKKKKKKKKQQQQKQQKGKINKYACGVGRRKTL